MQNTCTNFSGKENGKPAYLKKRYITVYDHDKKKPEQPCFPVFKNSQSARRSFVFFVVLIKFFIIKVEIVKLVIAELIPQIIITEFIIINIVRVFIIDNRR